LNIDDLIAAFSSLSERYPEALQFFNSLEISGCPMGSSANAEHVFPLINDFLTKLPNLEHLSLVGSGIGENLGDIIPAFTMP